jgi:hypothetical protein
MSTFRELGDGTLLDAVPNGTDHLMLLARVSSDAIEGTGVFLGMADKNRAAGTWKVMGVGPIWDIELEVSIYQPYTSFAQRMGDALALLYTAHQLHELPVDHDVRND